MRQNRDIRWTRVDTWPVQCSSANHSIEHRKPERCSKKKKKKKSYLTAKALYFQLLPPAAFVTIPFHFYVWQLHIALCSSRVPFQLRCPFKPTFRRDRKEVSFPSPDSSPRYLYVSLPLLFFFSIPSRSQEKARGEKIKKPSLWELKKKKKLHFLSVITFGRRWSNARKKTSEKTGRGKFVGLKILLALPSGQYNETMLVRRMA